MEKNILTISEKIENTNNLAVALYTVNKEAKRLRDAEHKLNLEMQGRREYDNKGNKYYIKHNTFALIEKLHKIEYKFIDNYHCEFVTKMCVAIRRDTFITETEKLRKLKNELKQAKRANKKKRLKIEISENLQKNAERYEFYRREYKDKLKKYITYEETSKKFKKDSIMFYKKYDRIKERLQLRMEKENKEIETLEALCCGSSFYAKEARKNLYRIKNNVLKIAMKVQTPLIAHKMYRNKTSNCDVYRWLVTLGNFTFHAEPIAVNSTQKIVSYFNRELEIAPSIKFIDIGLEKKLMPADNKLLNKIELKEAIKILENFTHEVKKLA